MNDSTRINELRKEIEVLCDNCDRPNKEEIGNIILSAMVFGFGEGLKAPSADRPQGEWKKTRNVHAWDVMGVESWGVERKCTNCGFKHIFIEDHGHYNFCPNCGADMRKESDR